MPYAAKGKIDVACVLQLSKPQGSSTLLFRIKDFQHSAAFLVNQAVKGCELDERAYWLAGYRILTSDYLYSW